MNLEQRVAEMKDLLTSPLDRLLATTESPIEAAMLLALICEVRMGLNLFEATLTGITFAPDSYPGADGKTESVPGALFERTWPNTKEFRSIEIYPQAQIRAPSEDTLRADFVVGAFRASLRRQKASLQSMHLVVECDGHEFHEKTKEQAAKDKWRDRQFAELGYRVLRFSGSEIYKDPKGAAESVARIISRFYGGRGEK